MIVISGESSFFIHYFALMDVSCSKGVDYTRCRLYVIPKTILYL